MMQSNEQSNRVCTTLARYSPDQGYPESATTCNCTICRRYGVLWAYDYEGERISAIPVDHFDDLDTFEDLSRDGRCVADHWF